MGYTRYWEKSERKVDEQLVNYVKKVLKKCGQLGIGICGWDGSGEPEVRIGKICFNGNGAKGLDHETFVIDDESSNEWNCDFCKTARKPYDYAVRRILKYMKRNGYLKGLSSDGPNENIVSDEDFLNGKW